MPVPLDKLRAKLGEKAIYTYRAERNFIDQHDKENTFNEIITNLLAKKAYYDHPNFAGRFIIKEFIRQRY